MDKKILLLSLLLLVTGSLFAQSSVEDPIAKIINALNTKNSQALISQLDDSCTIANLPRGHNDKVIPMVLRNYGAIASYKIVKQEKNGDKTKVFLDVVYQNGVAGHPWFLMDGTRVVEMHIIKDVSVTKDDDIGKATIGGKLPDVMAVPFHLYNNLIYVDAEINGKQGLFMLDSGSPVILLDKQFFPDSSLTADASNQLNLTGFSGKLNNVSLKEVKHLKWGDMELRNFNAASLDMPDKNNADDKKKVFGILGYEVFKDYEITFDYHKQVITLIKVDEAGNYIDKSRPSRKPLLQAAITMQRHIPIIPFKIDGTIYQMGIDCGANANVIYSKYYDQVKALLSQPMQQQLTTAGSDGGDTQTYLLKSASVGRLVFKNMLTILSDDNMYIPRPENKLQIDGLLGAPFLSQFVISINYKAGKIFIY